MFQVMHSLADGLGIALEELREVLHAAMTEFEGFNGRIASAILLRKPVEEMLHLPLNGLAVRLHNSLLECTPFLSSKSTEEQQIGGVVLDQVLRG